MTARVITISGYFKSDFPRVFGMRKNKKQQTFLILKSKEVKPEAQTAAQIKIKG